jgi:AcrB/AcrD/AcrF family
MNPIVFALRRPYTVMVAVIAVAMGSGLALSRMSIDIFPNLNLPVVYVCQPYVGMDPAQMEGLLTNYYEYHLDSDKEAKTPGGAARPTVLRPGWERLRSARAKAQSSQRGTQRARDPAQMGRMIRGDSPIEIASPFRAGCRDTPRGTIRFSRRLCELCGLRASFLS